MTPSVTAVASPESITWAQFFGFDQAYHEAREYLQDPSTGQYVRTPFLRGEIPIGPPAAEVGAALKSIWSSTNKLSSVRNAFRHWLSHGKEFSNLQNAKQYVEEATEFVTHPPGGTLSKVRANGETVLYNPSTNTFAVKTADGVPKTMFKPSGNGMAYFSRQ